MSMSTICGRCKEPIVAVDEDDLVAQVQEHARHHGGAHGKHVPTREHILAHAQQNPPADVGDPTALHLEGEVRT